MPEQVDPAMPQDPISPIIAQLVRAIDNGLIDPKLWRRQHANIDGRCRACRSIWPCVPVGLIEQALKPHGRYRRDTS
jgi:hypothetical protein